MKTNNKNEKNSLSLYERRDQSQEFEDFVTGFLYDEPDFEINENNTEYQGYRCFDRTLIVNHSKNSCSIVRTRADIHNENAVSEAVVKDVHLAAEHIKENYGKKVISIRLYASYKFSAEAKKLAKKLNIQLIHQK